jgi:hypothetical protein
MEIYLKQNSWQKLKLINSSKKARIDFISEFILDFLIKKKVKWQ